jgi:hypothetical protein
MVLLHLQAHAICPAPNYTIRTRVGGSVLIDGFEWEDARFLAPGFVHPEVPVVGNVYAVPEEYLWPLVEPMRA